MKNIDRPIGPYIYMYVYIILAFEKNGYSEEELKNGTCPEL